MGQIEERLEQLGLRLPDVAVPRANYRPIKIHGGLAYIAGHGPVGGGGSVMEGKLGEDLTAEQGYEAAKLTALSILASLKDELGELDRVTTWIRAVGYIHCAPGFGGNAQILDGFSDLIIDLWGEAGRHARSAPGQGPSPFNVPIIVDAIAAVE